MHQSIQQHIIALEIAALERWNNGDPDGYLALSSLDVIYIDPFFEQKLEGFKALKEYYERIRGKIHVDHYELLNPTVQLMKDRAVLTFKHCSYCGEKVYKWNCTDVYQLNLQWQIIHTPWSLIENR